MGQDVHIYGIRTYHIYIYIYILGECGALRGEREGVVWCIIGSSPPPTVACKTTGEGTPGEEAM